MEVSSRFSSLPHRTEQSSDLLGIMPKENGSLTLTHAPHGDSAIGEILQTQSQCSANASGDGIHRKSEITSRASLAALPFHRETSCQTELRAPCCTHIGILGAEATPCSFMDPENPLQMARLKRARAERQNSLYWLVWFSFPFRQGILALICKRNILALHCSLLSPHVTEEHKEK